MALWETYFCHSIFFFFLCKRVCINLSVPGVTSAFGALIRRDSVICHNFFSKKTLAPARLRKTPHPPKPPHVPFSCLRLLHSHDPLTKASSPVEYHMFLVKPNFFFSSFKTSMCQAKSTEKAPLLPFFSPPSAWHVSEYFKSLRF